MATYSDASKRPRHGWQQIRIRVGLLFGLPILVFLCLWLFGENSYEMPVYFEKPPEGALSASHPTGCLGHTYPHRVFADAAVAHVFQADVALYIFYYARTATAAETLARVHEKTEEKGQVHLYGFLNQDIPLTQAPSLGSLESLPTDSLPYVHNCVLRIAELFGGKVPMSWAIFIDKQGRIRGFLDVSQGKGLREGVAMASLLLTEAL